MNEVHVNRQQNKCYPQILSEKTADCQKKL